MSRETGAVGASRAVLLVARRELNTRLRTRSFVVATAVTLVLLVGYVLLQAALSGDANRSTVGLSGQATAFARPLTESARQLGLDVRTRDVADVADGVRQVRDGELTVLVSGAPDGPQVVVKDELRPELRGLLNGLVQQQVLTGQLAAAADAGLDPKEVLDTLSAAQVKVTELEPRDPEYGQRLAVGLIIAFLLYLSLVMYGQLVAQGVVEEKSSRVVEILLATVRPWQLLAGKVAGLGLVGLIQFAIIGGAGLVVATATGVLTVSATAAGTLAWGLVWYLLGYFLYATVFAAAGSLVSRQEDAQSVVAPVMMVIVIGFVLSVNLFLNDPKSTTVQVLSLLPPFAPLLMPGRTALGGVPVWQVGLSVALTLAALVLITWLAGRIYRNSVLRIGGRVRLRDALA